MTDTLINIFSHKEQIPSIASSLNALNEICNKNQIKLIAIQTPVYKVIYRDSSFLQAKELCNELHISFFDANREYIRNNINFFYNSNHLNNRGVNEMNKVLMSDTAFANEFRNNTR